MDKQKDKKDSPPEESEAEKVENKEKEEELVWDEKTNDIKADEEKDEGEEVEDNEEEDEENPVEAKEEEGSSEVEDIEEENSADEEIKKSEVLRHDLNKFVRDNQPSYNLTPQSKKSSGKLVTLVLFILAVLVIGGGIYFIAGVSSPRRTGESTEVPTATPEPTPTPEALNRSEWSFEVLNGSGVTGAAKKIADELKELGYLVTKTGNADRDDYETNQFFVSDDFADKVDVVVVDIKDIIKIASISGRLSDSTPSARIIIGR